MICTVSTVLDTPENVEKFVRRNLAAGVDHMFVFLDERQPGVQALLDPMPEVTAIGTGDGYWGGSRPPNLNNRQTANANLVRVLLSCLDWPRWLFHIDADECLDIDKDKLLALDATVPAVVLQTLEAVSTPGGDPQERFKRQLGEEDLALLHLLGVIDRPANTSLFNSHAHGKVGIRPTLDFNLHIHRARYPDRDFVESYEAEWLRLLHYDSTSVEEFIRKWSTHAASVSDSAFGRERAAILASVRSVQRNQSLSDERKQHYFAEIYRRTVQDDVDALADLGFLSTPSPAWHGHLPESLSPDRTATMHRLLAILRATDKNYFRPGRPGFEPVDLLRRVSRELASSDRALARAIGERVARPAAVRRVAHPSAS